jgi:hypothetical protein
MAEAQRLAREIGLALPNLSGPQEDIGRHLRYHIPANMFVSAFGIRPNWCPVGHLFETVLLK